MTKIPFNVVERNDLSPLCQGADRGLPKVERGRTPGRPKHRLLLSPLHEDPGIRAKPHGLASQTESELRDNEGSAGVRATRFDVEFC